MSKYTNARLGLIFSLFLGGMLNTPILSSETDMIEENLQLVELKKDSQVLIEEKGILRSSFLPELSIETGYEISKKTEEEIERGPIAYFEGRTNLYRGKSDSNLIQKNNILAEINELTKSKKILEIKNEVFKKISEKKLLEIININIKNEIAENKQHYAMALKKTSAGLSSNADLLDFDIKNQNLQSLLNSNNLKIENLEKETKGIFFNKYTLTEIENQFYKGFEYYVGQTDKLKKYSNMNIIDIKIVSKNIESLDYDRRLVQAEYGPTVDFETKWGQITPNKDLFKEKEEYQFGLVVHFPLYSGNTTSFKNNQNALERAYKQREMEQLKIDSTSTYDSKISEIENLKKLLASYELILEKSKKYKELTISEYRKGIKNSPDLISASDKFFETQNKILETKTEISNLVYQFENYYKN